LNLYSWPIAQVQLNLLDSHDTARFIHQASGDREALRSSILFLMTMPGAPCLYYGTEVGMTGGPDPDCRRAFPWEPVRWDHGLLAWTQRAIALRHAQPALRRGSFRRVYAYGGVYAFARTHDEDTLIIVYNSRNEPQRVSLSVGGLLPEGPVEDIWGGMSGRVRGGTLRDVLLAGRSAAVFVPAGRASQPAP
jgi:cyclomaltodextrinase / maltogenic alpha-amylase / neopullulanase